MSLVPCKTCKKEVARNAKTCPHCGVKDPGVTAGQTFIGFLIIAAVVVVIAVACSGNDKESENPKLSDAECMESLECIGNKGTFTAGVKCPSQIEKLAKNAVKWTDGTLEPKFSHFRWKDKEAGIVTHIGDKLQVQNDFGAYINIIYSCDLDMKQSPAAVVGVDAVEGRL